MTPLPLLAGLRARCRACYCGPAAPVTPPTVDLTAERSAAPAWPPPLRRPVICSRRCACHGPRRSSRSAVYAAAAADAARLALLRERRQGSGRHLVSV